MSGAAFLAAATLVALQRVGELAYARRTAAALRAAGARFVREDGFGLILVVHASWFLAMGLEAALAGVRLGPWTFVGGALFVAGQGLRYWSMAALGARWSTRVWVLPEAPLVTGGPYRHVRHPIYVGVALELFGFPLAFGLWRTALAILPLHLLALLRRIHREESALGIRRTG